LAKAKFDELEKDVCFHLPCLWMVFSLSGTCIN
jgi:hypothetical protein